GPPMYAGRRRMNRLRDESGWDSVSERGIELLRRVPDSSSRLDLKRRVWAGVQEICVNAAVEPRHARVKAFALGIAVVASAATAGAAIGGRWIAPRIDRTIVADATPRAEAQPRHHRGAIRRVAEAWEPSEIEAPAPLTSERVAAPSVTDLHAQSRPVRHVATPVVEGRTEVLDALVALRRDHDADRAAELLDRYLGANRHGALREEALALAIEAADTRADATDARRLARLYLAEFPSGRFGQFAGQHLGARAADTAP
ncbi:MAG TPA: hypothetical protein VI456_15810, partial [Polyangia bacterium]